MPIKRLKITQKALTLIELLFTLAILAFCLCGILLTYINMFLLSDLARDLTLATNTMQAEMEDVKKTAFDGLAALNGTTFDLSGFAATDAKGRIEVTDTAYLDLKRIRMVACFRSRGRLIGEDQNLDGQLIPAEDVNANGRMDSPAELVTLISR